MRKRKIALLSTFIVFLLLISVFSLFFMWTSMPKWWQLFYRVRIAYVPFGFFLLGLSLGIGGLVGVFLIWYQRQLLLHTSEALHLVAQGYLQEQSGTLSSIPTKYHEVMAQDLATIRQSLQALSVDLQQVSQDQQLTTQTKEEILNDERKRLARELHDSVSQQLFAAMMLLSAITKKTVEAQKSEQLEKQLQLILSIVQEAQEEMRALLLHLRPLQLSGKTLQEGIVQLLTELQGKIKTHVRWQLTEQVMPAYIEDQLFRIVQELLSNTLRHAKAQELEVYLHVVHDQLILRVLDDGQGFDPQDAKVGNYGLMNVRERVASLGGVTKIISFKEQGTSIEIKIPLTEVNEA